VIKEDRSVLRCFFWARSFGLWVSIDGGQRWAEYKAAISSVAVRDIVVHAGRAI